MVELSISLMERYAGGSCVVWFRAIEHLKGRGGENTELMRLLRDAQKAEEQVKMYLCHKRMSETRNGLRD